MGMIRSFLHKGLSELWENGRSAKVDRRLQGRVIRRLSAMDAATKPSDLNIPGFDFHALRGFSPTRYSIHINGPWCLTFQFDGEDIERVNLEQYH